MLKQQKWKITKYFTIYTKLLPFKQPLKLPKKIKKPAIDYVYDNKIITIEARLIFKCNIQYKYMSNIIDLPKLFLNFHATDTDGKNKLNNHKFYYHDLPIDVSTTLCRSVYCIKEGMSFIITIETKIMFTIMLSNSVRSIFLKKIIINCNCHYKHDECGCRCQEITM